MVNNVLRKIYKRFYSDPVAMELDRLVRLPRYTATETYLLGEKVIIVDGPSFVHGYEEIFKSEIYKFSHDNDSPLIIDCGANIGLATLFFKHHFPNAKILAFEPDPHIFNVLSENVGNFSFKDIELHQKAVWINDDGVNFVQEGGFSGRIPIESDRGIKIKVPSVDLSEVLKNYEEIDFLKIDIEGAEYEVIMRINSQLKKVKHLFLEYHSKKDQPQTLHELLSILFLSGFRYHVHEAFVRKNPFIDTEDMLGMDLQLNIYAYR